MLPIPYVKLILFKMPRVESVFLMSFSLLHLLQSSLFYLHVEPNPLSVGSLLSQAIHWETGQWFLQLSGFPERILDFTYFRGLSKPMKETEYFSFLGDLFDISTSQISSDCLWPPTHWLN